MTAATLTEATAAGKLLDELRELLARHDGAETLDEVRELADDVTAVLRRARGRIARLARKATKTEAPSQQTSAQTTQQKPAAPAMPLPQPQDAPPLSAYRVSPLQDAAWLQERKGRSYGDYQRTVLCTEIGVRAYQALSVPMAAPAALEPNPPAPTRVAPQPRRIGTVRYVLAAVAVHVERAGRRITKAVRRACGAFAMAVAR